MGLTDFLKIQGELEKLRITAFADEEFETATESFLILYNPTTYSETKSVQWLPLKSAQENSKEKVFRTVKSDKVSFEFLFDATGASPTSKSKPGSFKSDSKAKAEGAKEFDAADLIEKTSPDDLGKRHVKEAIDKFFNIAYDYQSDTHQTNYLQINWGAFEFQGVLESATVNYKLFNSSGLPIRASLTANFTESIAKPVQALKQKKKSADLTHIRIVKDGDTLPLIANEIYGDPSFYLELARINNISNFRNLEAGMRLLIPPIDNNVISS